MNNQEKMMILKMLEEGKINAKEAEKLIDAVNEGGIDSFIGENAERLKALFAEIKVKAAELAKKMEPTVNEAKEKIVETYKKMEPSLKDAGKKVAKTTGDIIQDIAKRFDKKDE